MERMPWRVGRATLDVVQLVAMPPDAVLQLDAVIITVAAPLCLQPQTFLDPQQAGGVPHFSFSPQGAQLVSRNPGVVNETLFGHPSSFTRKVPVGVVCRLWLPPWRHRTHLFVCTRCFRLFVFFFFFSRCRESRAPTCGRVHPPMLNSCTALPPRRGSLCGRLSFYCVYGQPG